MACQNADSVRRITTVHGVLAFGFLDGRSVTTHWRFAKDVARRLNYGSIRKSLYPSTAKFLDFGGVTSGIDLSPLIEEDYGPETGGWRELVFM